VHGVFYKQILSLNTGVTIKDPITPGNEPHTSCGNTLLYSFQLIYLPDGPLHGQLYTLQCLDKITNAAHVINPKKQQKLNACEQ